MCYEVGSGKCDGHGALICVLISFTLILCELNNSNMDAMLISGRKRLCGNNFQIIVKQSCTRSYGQNKNRTS